MKALNRKEVLVNAKANGTLDSFKPLTRDEAFTKKALGLGAGAFSWNDLSDKPFGEIIEAITIDYSQPDVESIIEGCGAFNVGETVTITIDGVKYSLVAFDEGYATIGDKYTALAGGTGELGWLVYTDSDGEVYFLSNKPHTVEIISKAVKTLDSKYVPPEAFVPSFTFDFDIGDPELSVQNVFDTLDEYFWNGYPIVVTCGGDRMRLDWYAKLYDDAQLGECICMYGITKQDGHGMWKMKINNDRLEGGLYMVKDELSFVGNDRGRYGIRSVEGVTWKYTD